MPRLYDQEEEALKAKLWGSIKYGLMMYYVFVIGGMFLENWDTNNFDFVFNPLFIAVFVVLLPLIATIFYYLGGRLNYEPKERFLPKPTVARMFRDAESDNPVQDRIGRQLDKIQREDKKQKRDDAWRRDMRAAQEDIDQRMDDINKSISEGEDKIQPR